MEESTKDCCNISLGFQEEEIGFLGESRTHYDNVSNPLSMDTRVSQTTLLIFTAVVEGFMNGCVSIIGIVANIVNIIVFVRQGVFTDSGTVSLLGLAVSDLCCVTTSLWISISSSIELADPPGLSWNPWELAYLTAGWPHLACAQITRMVTAYVAFERCVCVVFPFKVKMIFNPRRSVIIIASIFACCVLMYSPVYITQQLVFRMDPTTNISRLVLVKASNSRVIIRVMHFINSIGFNIGSVATVFVCTMITTYRLRLSKAWRNSLATGGSLQLEKSKLSHLNATSSKPSMDENNQDIVSKQNAKSNKTSKPKVLKETKSVQMIVTISIIFLICYIPDMTYLFVSTINPDFRIMRKYHNFALMMYSTIFLMETTNSSINIIVYYRMSSRYKQVLNRLFLKKVDST